MTHNITITYLNYNLTFLWNMTYLFTKTDGLKHITWRLC
jgi:hypothetical protein